MRDDQAFIEVLLAPKGVVFWLVTIAVCIAAATIFLMNARHRDLIDDALRVAAREHVPDSPAEGPPQTGIFDVCREEMAELLRHKALATPERLWCYDKGYLDVFIATASSQLTATGRNALKHYISPTLVWNDVAFAFALAISVALVALGMAPWLPWKPWTDHLMLFFALMGLLYGLADVAEDWKLAAVLDKTGPVDAADANTANLLTRIKLVTICLSGIGGLAFLLLQVVAGFWRSPVFVKIAKGSALLAGISKIRLAVGAVHGKAHHRSVGRNGKFGGQGLAHECLAGF